ncbi:MAG: hydrogenase formation protein HypD [Candidatus Hydrogenedentota bacterium]|nr:MAG: hydrogenase formation protein HypD [Candidatus Hydrogenedentota bacterium]
MRSGETDTVSGSANPLTPFRDSARVAALRDSIAELAARLLRPVRLMEVCGTHTMSAARTGLHSLLPESVRLTSGPGCPVCVTAPGYVVASCDLARRPEVIITTFGDMLRVPGGGRTLEEESAKGADVRVVYSPLDALETAENHPEKCVVFLGVGFETTAPTVAASILEARERNLRNYSVFAAHKTMPEAMRALLEAEDLAIDGFLCPGHVSVITGSDLYRFIVEEYAVPCAVTGFEPVEILLGVEALLRCLVEGRAEVVNVYRRAVRASGNIHAKKILEAVFEPCDSEWRGIGVIPRSGLAIREEFSDYDAARRFGVEIPSIPVPKACICGEVLRGAMEPTECRLFGEACTPTRPIGPCMVSSEGACAAAYKYGPA